MPPEIELVLNGVVPSMKTIEPDASTAFMPKDCKLAVNNTLSPDTEGLVDEASVVMVFETMPLRNAPTDQ